MAKTIVGFEKFESKKGMACCNVCCTEEFGNREGVTSVGTKCTNVMLFGDDCNVITKDSIGKTLVGFFGYSKGTIMIQSPSVQ